MLNVIDQINLRTLRSSAAVASNCKYGPLPAQERAMIERVATEFRGAPVLDLGVGGGRSVRSLLKVSDDYLGLDASAEMIIVCRKRFPWIRFANADLRSLKMIADNSVGMVVFSCNGISLSSHEDRLAILREVRRVLRPGGAFLFTTYNRNSPEAVAGFAWPAFPGSVNPLKLLVRLQRFARDSLLSLTNRLRYARHEQHNAQYALINSARHNHGVMLYYITLAQQRQQLVDCGFAANAEVLDREGLHAIQDTRSNSLAFIARKLRP
jgi:SAM-dependent methyltransferase